MKVSNEIFGAIRTVLSHAWDNLFADSAQLFLYCFKLCFNCLRSAMNSSTGTDSSLNKLLVLLLLIV